jgi:hypothetical protein
MRALLPLIALMACTEGKPNAAFAAGPDPLAEPPIRQELSLDGIRVGEPVSSFIEREPYRDPCDIDPIDDRKATVYFYASGTCRDRPGFPERTTLILVTPHNPEHAAEQPLTLMAWSGPYFDTRSNVRIRIGDDGDRVVSVLGQPSDDVVVKDLVDQGKEDPMANVHRWSFADRVHVLMRDDHAVAIGIGSLAGGPEQRGLLEHTYAHHLRYIRE